MTKNDDKYLSLKRIKSRKYKKKKGRTIYKYFFTKLEKKDRSYPSIE